MKTKAFAAIVLTLSLVITLFLVPSRASPDPIKIGIMGPLGLIQGDGMKEGAILAKEEIGTILGQPIELIFSDEFQGQADGTAETGRLAMEYLMAAGVDFAIGGFRTESVMGAREIAADYETIYLTTGAATDNIIDCTWPATGSAPCGACVRDNYERYKGLFRITPMNASKLVAGVIGNWKTGSYLPQNYGMVTYALKQLGEIFGYPVKYAAVVENLVWAQGFLAILSNMSMVALGYPPVFPYNETGLADLYLGSPASVKFGLPAGFAEFTGQIYPVSPTIEDLDAVLSAIKNGPDANPDTGDEARLIIQILSAEKAGRAFTIAWDKLGVKAIPIGINVIEQMSEAWEETDGGVEYESTLSTTGTRTPITATSTVTWDAYVERWGRAPIYTAWGAYAGMGILADAIAAAGTLDNDDIIPEIEKTLTTTGTGELKFTGPNPGHDNDYSDYDPLTAGDQSYPYAGPVNNRNPTMLGTLHDLYTVSYGPTWTDPYVRTLMCQWQNDVLEVVWPRDKPFSAKWGAPSRLYPLWETDVFTDGTVDPGDMAVVATAWQTVPGDTYWALDADMDNNGLIDISDISRVAKDWGKNEPVGPGYIPP